MDYSTAARRAPTWLGALALVVVMAIARAATVRDVEIRSFPVPHGAHPHDVWPGRNGIVWYTAQTQGALGRLDSRTGEVRQIPLGPGSAPHGVIVGADGAVWITDGGQNAILRFEPDSERLTKFPLPPDTAHANLNTATFDRRGRVWFTGQNGVYGRVDPASGEVRVYPAPRGPGAYGITATPDGAIYFASLAGSYIARIDPDSGAASVIEPPTRDQGARRIWSDSHGRLWVSEWIAGQLARYDPAQHGWKEWKLPGPSPHAYAVCVDARDRVWLSDFGANAVLRFDPRDESFAAFPSPRAGASVRQLAAAGPDEGGAVWGAESATDTIVSYREP